MLECGAAMRSNLQFPFDSRVVATEERRTGPSGEQEALPVSEHLRRFVVESPRFRAEVTEHVTATTFSCMTHGGSGQQVAAHKVAGADWTLPSLSG